MFKQRIFIKLLDSNQPTTLQKSINLKKFDRIDKEESVVADATKSMQKRKILEPRVKNPNMF